MKKTSLVISALALTLVGTGLPVFAHAQKDTSVETNVNIGTTGRPNDPRYPQFAGNQPNTATGFHGNVTAPHMGGPAEHPPRMGSSTPEERQQMMEERRASSTAARVAKVQDKSGAAIDERIKKIQMMITRVADMKEISDATRTSLTATLNAEISSLTDLKTKIGAETATTTLKLDAESITKSFRVYALVLPQSAITAASDRALSVVAQMQSFSDKLSARISASGNASLSSALSDMQAKMADAKTQALAAATAVKGLTPDNGDATLMASNAAALKDAKSKIDAAQADLKAARADIDTIMKGLKITLNASTSASTNTEVQ